MVSTPAESPSMALCRAWQLLKTPGARGTTTYRESKRVFGDHKHPPPFLCLSGSSRTSRTYNQPAQHLFPPLNLLLRDEIARNAVVGRLGERDEVKGDRLCVLEQPLWAGGRGGRCGRLAPSRRYAVNPRIGMPLDPLCPIRLIRPIDLPLTGGMPRSRRFAEQRLHCRLCRDLVAERHMKAKRRGRRGRPGCPGGRGVPCGGGGGGGGRSGGSSGRGRTAGWGCHGRPTSRGRSGGVT